MMPSYGYMNSNPKQQDQMPWMGYQQHPTTYGPYPEMDGSRPPFMCYNSWPYTNYPNSAPSHACCNHNFPGFYAPRPPCSHFQPGPPCQWYGNYPPYHEASHVPPPPYPPSYEYDKEGSVNYHFRGWPNYSHDQNKGNGVKIEEHEPEIEKKMYNNSLIPGQMKNYPYPVMWFPPEYRNVVPRDMEMPQYTRSSEQDPWNGWFPIDMRNLQSLLQGSNGKTMQSKGMEDKRGVQSGEDKKILNKWFPFPFNLNSLKMPAENGKQTENMEKSDQFPFPLVLMPSSNNQEEIEKENNKVTNDASKTVAEQMPQFRFIPVKLPINEDAVGKIVKADEEKNNGQAGGKTLEQAFNKETRHKDKDQSEGDEKGGRSVHMKQSKSNEADKPSKPEAKRDLASSHKASKLPPICLRVDPLPKKKNSNGNSRSSSPPVTKERVEKVKGPNTPEMKEEPKKGDTPNQIKSAQQVSKEKKIKNIKVFDGNTIKSKEAELGNMSQAQIPANLCVEPQEEMPKQSISERMDKGSHEVKEGNAKAIMVEETTMANKSTNVQALADGQHKPKRKLSELEAALLIQSTFRGFEVRKWEPLKKLKQLLNVQEQMTEVKSRVHSLEASGDLRKDDKQRLVIGEMIMNLLLKLDAIQELNPSLRDIRKTLAKELTSLQEQVDALMSKEPGRSAEEESIGTPASNVSIELVQNKEETCNCENICENPADISEIVKEKEGYQTSLSLLADVSGGQDENVAIVDSTEEGEQRIIENVSVESVRNKEEAGNWENTCDNPADISEIVIEKEDCKTSLPYMVDVSGSQDENVPIVESCKEGGQMIIENEVQESSDNNQHVMTMDKEEIGMLDGLEQSSQQLNIDDEEAGPHFETKEVKERLSSEQEVPQVIIEEGSNVTELADSEKVELSNSIHNQLLIEDANPDPLANLPVNFSATEKYENFELQGDDSQLNSEGKYIVPADVSSQTEEAPLISQSEQFSGESDDLVKVERCVGEDFQEGKMLEIQIDQTEKKDVNNNEGLKEEDTETHFMGVTADNDDYKDENHMNEVGLLFVPDSGTEAQGSGTSTNEQGPEFVIEATDSFEDEVHNVKPAESDDLLEVEAKSSQANNDQIVEEEQELSLGIPSPSARQVSEKLVEENEKLREIMEKLMLAGTKQLDAISKLTGRVQDLEKKLSKKKKLKMRSYKKSPFAKQLCVSFASRFNSREAEHGIQEENANLFILNTSEAHAILFI
ncbi:hypothetical protein ACFE04_018951 [Oxalis oulophora]